MNPKKLSTAFSLHLYFLITILNGNTGIAQRIVTIQLDGTQYYVSRMNPYSSELNYFLAYQYCRSIGLQLASFETKEKADAITEYLKNAGYNQYDFWTSGNHLGSNMLLWMSTGLPFNATFNYMRKFDTDDQVIPSGPLPMGRKKRGNILNTGCIAIKANEMDWDTEDCFKLKDFICEQTRCYFYNYGSIPVSPAQGHHKNKETTSSPSSTTIKQTTENIFQFLSSSNSSSNLISIVTTTTSPSIAPSTENENQADTEQPSSNSNEQQISNNGGSEEESNEIDLNTTETPTSDYSYVTIANEKREEVKETAPPILTHPRSTKILDSDTNSARNMPDVHGEVFPWTWAKNILLEKPVLKKTSQV